MMTKYIGTFKADTMQVEVGGSLYDYSYDSRVRPEFLKKEEILKGTLRNGVFVAETQIHRF